MLTRLALLLLAVITAKGAIITAAAQQAVYSPGNSIQVNVSTSTVADLYAFQFDLTFDPTVLSAQSVTEAGYFLSNGVSFFPGLIDNTAGSVSFIADSLAGSGPGYSGNTTLATIVFTALSPGATTVFPINVILLDSNLADISTNVVPANINVGSGSSVPEPWTFSLLGGGLVIFLVLGRLTHDPHLKKLPG